MNHDPERRNWLSLARHAAADLLFPPHCAFCAAAFDRDQPQKVSLLCSNCHPRLTTLAVPACRRCAMPCPEADAAIESCPQCRGRRMRYDAVRTLGMYQDELRQAVLKIKHAQHEPLAIELGRQLAQRLRQMPFEESPEVIAPVPMFWLKRLTRGTNAPDLIAQSLTAELRFPLALDLLVCRRYTRQQSTLSPDERKINVRGAYRTSRRYDVREAKILLVDDVVTTGATAHDAARALRQAGAAKVFVAAIARGAGL